MHSVCFSQNVTMSVGKSARLSILPLQTFLTLKFLNSFSPFLAEVPFLRSKLIFYLLPGPILLISTILLSLSSLPYWFCLASKHITSFPLKLKTKHHLHTLQISSHHGPECSRKQFTLHTRPLSSPSPRNSLTTIFHSCVFSNIASAIRNF